MTLPRPTRFLTLLGAIGVLAVAALVGAQPSSAKTYGCKAPSPPAGLNGGYFTELRVSGYSSKSAGCRSGRKLVIAYYKCRRQRGVKGSCNNKTVNGLKCKESRPASLQLETQLNARVTCRKASRSIRHSYQQNLRPS